MLVCCEIPEKRCKRLTTFDSWSVNRSSILSFRRESNTIWSLPSYTTVTVRACVLFRAKFINSIDVFKFCHFLLRGMTLQFFFQIETFRRRNLLKNVPLETRNRFTAFIADTPYLLKSLSAWENLCLPPRSRLQLGLVSIILHCTIAMFHFYDRNQTAWRLLIDNIIDQMSNDISCAFDRLRIVVIINSSRNLLATTSVRSWGRSHVLT